MAVKGETDPAARAHIHPTSSRKPAVVEATLKVGGAPRKMLFIVISSSGDVRQNACSCRENTKHKDVLQPFYMSDNMDHTGKCNVSQIVYKWRHSSLVHLSRVAAFMCLTREVLVL